MIEVPRRQSTGCCCPPDAAAESEEEVEEVFEGENEDGVEPGHEIEPARTGALRSHCVWDRSILRFDFMAAPNFSVADFTHHGAKIASGPVKEEK